MKPQDFLDKIVLAAQACQRATGIPASFTIAQAALESSWGAKAPGNNLFGIQADKAWKGATIDFATHEEYVKGVKTPVIGHFRAYPDWSASLLDHAQFFLKNPRYKACFQEVTGHGWCLAAARAGYATDKTYADKLIGVINARNLTRFDTPAAA